MVISGGFLLVLRLGSIYVDVGPFDIASQVLGVPLVFSFHVLLIDFC
jgi:hypothetical protein